MLFSFFLLPIDWNAVVMARIEAAILDQEIMLGMETTHSRAMG